MSDQSGSRRTATGTPATQSSTSPRVHPPSSFGSRTTSRVSLMRFVGASCQANLQRISNTAVGLASRIHESRLIAVTFHRSARLGYALRHSYTRMVYRDRRYGLVLLFACLVASACRSQYDTVRNLKDATVPAGDNAPALDNPDWLVTRFTKPLSIFAVLTRSISRYSDVRR